MEKDNGLGCFIVFFAVILAAGLVAAISIRKENKEKTENHPMVFNPKASTEDWKYSAILKNGGVMPDSLYLAGYHEGYDDGQLDGENNDGWGHFRDSLRDGRNLKGYRDGYLYGYVDACKDMWEDERYEDYKEWGEEDIPDPRMQEGSW